MSDVLDELELPEAAVLESARSAAKAAGAAYSGSLSPQDAWALAKDGRAVLVDVRSAEERKFVGFIPEAVHVAWATGTALTRNPRFVRELEGKVSNKHAIVVLLCRSGKRSALAAEAATKAGFQNVFHISEGFEGELDANHQRGHSDGWRFHGLPWVQD